MPISRGSRCNNCLYCYDHHSLSLQCVQHILAFIGGTNNGYRPVGTVQLDSDRIYSLLNCLHPGLWSNRGHIWSSCRSSDLNGLHGDRLHYVRCCANMGNAIVWQGFARFERCRYQQHSQDCPCGQSNARRASEEHDGIFSSRWY